MAYQIKNLIEYNKFFLTIMTCLVWQFNQVFKNYFFSIFNYFDVLLLKINFINILF